MVDIFTILDCAIDSTLRSCAARGCADLHATSWLPSSSSALIIAEWSHPLPPRAAQALNSSWHVAVLGN
jgi:hypothetical protein